MNEELKVIITAVTDKLKKELEAAKKDIGSFKDRVKEAGKTVDEDFKKAGESISKGMKVAAVGIAAAGTAILALGASTAEYRQEQAKLNSAFEAAGSSAEVAKNTYNDLYRVLGDGGQATEAAAHLAKLTTDQKELSEWTNICQGIYATFGASLPIEGLTEAANETAKVGTLTGGLADALNWAGLEGETFGVTLKEATEENKEWNAAVLEATSAEDYFNLALQQCNTEAEREALIRETLNGIYSEAAATYEKNAAETLAQNEAQAKLSESMAQLGAVTAPIITMLTELATKILAVLTPYIQEFAENYLPIIQEVLGAIGEKLGEALAFLLEHKTVLAVLAGAITAIVTAIGLYNAVAAVKAAMDAAQVTTIWGLVAAHAAQAVAAMAALAPYLLIVAAVAAVIAIFVVLWNKCEGFRDFWKGLWEKLKEVFSQFVESLKPLWEAIVEAFKEAWELIKVIWDKVKPYFEGIWNTIKIIFSVVKDVLGGFFKAAWENIKIVWNVVVSYFKTLFDNIKLIFSAVKSVLTGDFKGAWESIKKVFSNWGSFFSGLFNSIKKIFGNIASAIGNAVSSTVKGAINAVLSTAVNIINGFIRSINAAIGIINAIPGVKIGKINLLNVPKLEQGGVLEKGQVGLLEGNGTEAVVPLENNLEWLDKMAAMLSARMGGNAPIILQVDGKTFGEISVNSINELTKQRGVIPLVMA